MWDLEKEHGSNSSRCIGLSTYLSSKWKVLVGEKSLTLLTIRILPFLEIVFFLNFFIFIYFWERKRQSMSRGGAEREGDTESEAGSRLRTVSTEPDTGLEPTNGKIMTSAEVGRLTEWTTRHPRNSLKIRAWHPWILIPRSGIHREVQPCYWLYYFMLVDANVITPSNWVLAGKVWNFPDEIWNWPLYTEGKESLKREADYSRLVGVSFKKGTDTWGLSPWPQGKWISAFAHLTLKSFYGGLNWVQSHIQSRWSKQHLVLYILETALAMGMVGGMDIPRTGEEVGCLQLPGSNSWVNLWSLPLHDLLRLWAKMKPCSTSSV